MINPATWALVSTIAGLGSIGTFLNVNAKQERVATLVAQKQQFQTSIYRNNEHLGPSTDNKHGLFLLDVSSAPHIMWVRAERQASVEKSSDKSDSHHLDCYPDRRSAYGNGNDNNNNDCGLMREGVGLATGFRVSPNFKYMPIQGSDVRIVQDEIFQSRAALRKVVDASNIVPMSHLFGNDAVVSALGVRTWPRLRSRANIKVVGSKDDDNGEDTSNSDAECAMPAPPYRVTSYTVPGLLFSVSRDATGQQRQFTVHAAGTSPDALANHTFDDAIREAKHAETTAHLLFGATMGVWCTIAAVACRDNSRYW